MPVDSMDKRLGDLNNKIYDHLFINNMKTLKNNLTAIGASLVFAGALTFLTIAVVHIIALTNAGYINWAN